MTAQPHDCCDEAALFLLANQTGDAKQKDRYRVAFLAVRGAIEPEEELEREEIAELTGRSRQFVDEWIGRYRRGGIDALTPIKQPGRPSFLVRQEKETLKKILDKGPQEGVDPRSVFFGEDIRQLIHRRFGKLYSLSGTYRLLGELGYSWLCPRPHHPKADPVAQDAFKKIVDDIDEVRAAHPDKRVLTYFQDEARFGQKGTIARVWAKRGSRPSVPRQTQYDYLYVFGAACCESGDAIAMIAPLVNTDVMNHFLEGFSNSLKPDVHAVMILDQAGWHRSKKLVVPKNLTLIPLPPRSPELNPIENLWHWVTSHHWSNRVHADYESMLDAACHAMSTTLTDRERVKTLCNAPYLTRANQV